MLTRKEVIIKWSLYAAATVLCVLVQTAILQRVSILGVIPFLYPMLAAIPATYEAPVPSTIFTLCVGVFCDLLLPDSTPCLYTLIFPLAGLCAALLSQSLLHTGFLCSLASTAAAFLLTDLFRCFLLWTEGHLVWSTGIFLMLREFCVTAPLSIPVTALYRVVYRKTHMYD